MFLLKSPNLIRRAMTTEYRVIPKIQMCDIVWMEALVVIAVGLEFHR